MTRITEYSTDGLPFEHQTSPSITRPWWLSGLERVSNSSRCSLKDPRFESRLGTQFIWYHEAVSILLAGWFPRKNSRRPDSIYNVYYIWHNLSSFNYWLYHRCLFTVDYYDRQHKVQRYLAMCFLATKVNGRVRAPSLGGRSPAFETRRGVRMWDKMVPIKNK